MAARARSAPLGRSKWPLEFARLRQGARNCSAWLVENTAPADVSEFEPARLRWGARHWRSSPLGSAGPETLHWAGPRMPVALNTETNILRAWYARVHPSLYIYIYNIYLFIFYILDSHMAPYGACEVAQSTARSKAQFEAERFRKGFRRKNKHDRKCFRRKTSMLESAFEVKKKHARTVISSALWPRQARAVISSAQWLRSMFEQ